MTSESGGLTVELSGVLTATPARVFALLTEPGELKRWWGPAGFSIPSVEVDLREGGAYRIAMQPPEGELFHLRGEYREVDPPHRLAYTFRWEEPDPDDRETVAELTLEDLGGATELRLVQGSFATEARRALHDAGWSDSFAKLRALTAPGA